MSTDRLNRLAPAMLAAAIVLYAALALYLTRGAIPYYDSMAWLLRAADGFDLETLLEPHNGHLIAITRVIYAAGLGIFGPEQIVFQLAQIVAVAASAWLLFVLLRRRMDAALALVPALLVLFLGSTTVLIDANVAVFAQSTAFGLGALLALERGDRLGDVVGFVLLTLGLLSFSLGLPFALGAGVLIALRGNGLRRAWVVVVPLLLYGAWLAWAQQFNDGAFELGRAGPETGPLADLLFAPLFAADSLAAALAAVMGLGGDLVGDFTPGLLDIGWGRVLAVAAFMAVAYRALGGGLSAWGVALAVVLAVFWGLGALNISGLRLPPTERYAFPAAALCILILAELLPRPLPVSRRLLIAAAALLLFAIPGNLYDLKTNGASIRGSSAQARADLAMAELTRAEIPPDAEVSPGLLAPTTAATWFAFADEYGSIAFTPEELEDENADIRQWADIALRRNLGLEPVPVDGAPARGCEPVTSAGGPIELTLPPGGAVLRASGGEVGLRRFGDAPYEFDPLPRHGYVAIAIPTDASPRPWIATVEGAASVEVCPLDAAGAGEPA